MDPDPSIPERNLSESKSKIIRPSYVQMHGLVTSKPIVLDPKTRMSKPTIFHYIFLRFIRVTFVEVVKFRISLTDFWLI